MFFNSFSISGNLKNDQESKTETLAVAVSIPTNGAIANYKSEVKFSWIENAEL